MVSGVVPGDTDNSIKDSSVSVAVQFRDFHGGNIYINAPAALPARTERKLRVLVVDDQPRDLDEIARLLSVDSRIGKISRAADAMAAIMHINRGRDENLPYDAAFLDILMPGLNGMHLAKILSAFRVPPRIVFVTTDEKHAVDAFEIEAVDYLLKPIRPTRMTAAVDKLVHH